MRAKWTSPGTGTGKEFQSIFNTYFTNNSIEYLLQLYTNRVDNIHTDCLWSVRYGMRKYCNRKNMRLFNRRQ